MDDRAARVRTRPGAPFAHLNLRRNPFGTLTPDEQVDLAVIATFDSVIARLHDGDRFAIQFVGEKGRGKSTHLRVLEHAIAGAAYCFFPEDGPAPDMPRAGVLILDELQRMPRRARARLFRAGRPLVIGTHEDHRRELAIAGYDIDHRQLDGPDVATLTMVVARRIAACIRGPGPAPRVTSTAIGRLHVRHGGDVRAILDALYERFQTLKEPVDVDM